MENPTENSNENSKLNKLSSKLSSKRRIYFPIFVGLTIVLSLVMLYVIVVGVGLYAFKWRYNFVKKTVAIVPYPAGWVNVFPIRYGEVFHEVEPAKKFYAQTGSPVPDQATLEKQAMDFLVKVKTVQEYAGVYHISVPVKDVNDALDKLYQENGGKASFEQILNQYYGYMPSDIYRLVYLSLMQQKLNDYYDTNVVKQVQLSQILLSDETKANDILAKAKKGTDFATLAKQNSLDKNSKDKGGDLGYSSKDNLYKVIIKGTNLDKTFYADFQKKIWGAKSGDLFLFHTDLGWQIIKVTSFKGNQEDAFDVWLQNKIDKGFVLRII